jgi:NAD(P)-dependent dehydrogenase (short-subunit alcohol dehydrogenase family)
MRLVSQAALVTGAAAGISRAIALCFAREGAVVVAADASEAGAIETAELIRRERGATDAAKLDISNADEAHSVVQRTVACHGDLHVLFNGAGILAYGDALETSVELTVQV